jgi:hypothetical protein
MGAWMASEIVVVVARFPQRELEIRRQYARDPKFREICEDYDVALAELQHCERAGPAGAARAEDLRRIRDELEVELLGVLDSSRGCGRRPDEP